MSQRIFIFIFITHRHTQQASQEGLSLLLIFSHIVYINHDRTIKYYIQIIV